MALLRNEKFQNLLLKYRRKPRTFLVAYDTKDDVTSTPVISDSLGNKWKPDDYARVSGTLFPSWTNSTFNSSRGFSPESKTGQVRS